MPSAIHFASDQEGVATRVRLPWPLFWAAWKWTGERRYLQYEHDHRERRQTILDVGVLDAKHIQTL